MHTKHGQDGRCRRPCSSSAGSAGGGGSGSAQAGSLTCSLPTAQAPCCTAGWMSSEAHPAGDGGAEQQPTLDQSMPHTAGEAPPEPLAAVTAFPAASEPAGSDEHPPSTSKVCVASQNFCPLPFETPETNTLHLLTSLSQTVSGCRLPVLNRLSSCPRLCRGSAAGTRR